MTTALRTVAYSLASFLVVDALGFMGWVLSNQHPVDNAYLGTVTAHIIRLVVG